MDQPYTNYGRDFGHTSLKEKTVFSLAKIKFLVKMFTKSMK